jgi:hypothetical protein
MDIKEIRSEIGTSDQAYGSIAEFFKQSKESGSIKLKEILH